MLDYGNNRVQLGQPGQNQLLIDGQPLRVAVEGLPEKTSESTLSGDYQAAITQQEEDAKREKARASSRASRLSSTK